jgi:hypothetical protein
MGIGVVGALVAVMTVVGSEFVDDPPEQAQTTFEDFATGGSQWGINYQEFVSSNNCGYCHGTYDDNILLMQSWQGSMHAQAGRDPMFYAALAIAEQDAAFVGDFCIHCHVPRAWLNGRARVTDGSQINNSDRDGINCQFCHLLVDPVYKPGISPAIDENIVNNVAAPVVNSGNANFVIDILDRRRGKRGATNPQPHSQIVAPYQTRSDLCESCHDISNPVFMRQEDDTYVPTDMDEPHPTGDKYDMFPLERTSSEWKMSQYASQGVEVGDRFGGNKTVMRTCQDCHMPYSTSRSADFPAGFPVHDDLAMHGSVGGNTTVPQMIANLCPDEVNVDAIHNTIARARQLLEVAATLHVSQSGDAVHVRIINECGHKLPTGMSSGRRMWVNVQYRNSAGELIGERGAYDEDNAELTLDTHVYQQQLGVDEAMAEATGLPVGPSHHSAFDNVIYKDNRIPPRGFTNESFRRIQSPPVGAGYSDGQYWDDIEYTPPVNAASVTVRLFFQTISKDFAEFLRDANYTNDTGDIFFEQWTLTGKSPPVEMASETIELAGFEYGDLSGDGAVNLLDHAGVSGCLAGPDGAAVAAGCEAADLNGDDIVDLVDVGRFQRRFGTIP